MTKKTIKAEANSGFSGTGNSSPLETDPLKNKAAEKVLGLLIHNYEGSEIPDSLVKKSGKALANRFLFALCKAEAAEGGFFVRFAPVNDRSYDQHLAHVIEHLLPPLKDPGMTRECMEATFDFSECKDPVALAKELMSRGFVWEKKFQEENDLGSTTPVMPYLRALEQPAVISASSKKKTNGPGL